MLLDETKIKMIFSSENKIMVCLVLQNKKLSLSEIASEIETKFKKKKNRETIYRALDALNKIKIVGKIYDEEEKKIKYYLKIKQINFNFIKGKVEVLDNEL